MLSGRISWPSVLDLSWQPLECFIASIFRKTSRSKPPWTSVKILPLSQPIQTFTSQANRLQSTRESVTFLSVDAAPVDPFTNTRFTPHLCLHQPPQTRTREHREHSQGPNGLGVVKPRHGARVSVSTDTGTIWLRQQVPVTIRWVRSDKPRLGGVCCTGGTTCKAAALDRR
jgi:hypothetical protein